MPHFGRRSEEKLATCHPDIQRVLREAIKGPMDFTIVCGRRSKEEQDEAFTTGKSKKRWPNSRHNVRNPDDLSDAVDVAPWNAEEGIDWNDHLAFARLYGIIEKTAHDMNIRLRWGGDWDRNTQSNDQSFMDIGHFERI